MLSPLNEKRLKTYEYKKFMRDGSVKTITAVVRNKKEKKKTGMGDG